MTTKASELNCNEDGAAWITSTDKSCSGSPPAIDEFKAVCSGVCNLLNRVAAPNVAPMKTMAVMPILTCPNRLIGFLYLGAWLAATSKAFSRGDAAGVGGVGSAGTKGNAAGGAATVLVAVVSSEAAGLITAG